MRSCFKVGCCNWQRFYYPKKKRTMWKIIIYPKCVCVCMRHLCDLCLEMTWDGGPTSASSLDFLRACASTRDRATCLCYPWNARNIRNRGPPARWSNPNQVVKRLHRIRKIMKNLDTPMTYLDIVKIYRYAQAATLITWPHTAIWLWAVWRCCCQTLAWGIETNG